MFGVAATANSGLLEDTNYHEGDLSRRCNTSLVVAWLRDNYRFGKSGSISKNSVYQHYLDECRGRGLETDINQTYFGKLVKKAFAGIQYNRKGPRGRSEHHYKRLKRAKHHAAGTVVLPPSHAFATPPTTTPPPSYHHRHPHGPPPPPRHHDHCPGTPAFHSPRHQRPTAVVAAAAAEAVGGSLSHTPRRDTEVIGRTSSRSPSPPSSPHQWGSAHHQHQQHQQHQHQQHQHHAPLGASFPLPPATAPGQQYALAHQQHQHQQQAPPHALFPNHHQHHHQQQRQAYVVAEAAVPAWCHRCCANSNSSSGGGGGGGGEAMDPFGVVTPSSSPVPHRACSPTMPTWQGSLFQQQHQQQQHRENADEEVEVEASLFQPRQGWTLRQSTINRELPYCWW